MNSPNNRVQRTLHKVSGPLTRDVGSKYMKITAYLLAIIVLASGCASPRPQSKTLHPIPETALQLLAEPRLVPSTTPYTVLCNVVLRYFSNSEKPAESCGTVTFYAEQGGLFYPLREIEEPGGRSPAPYHPMWSVSVTLPRPPMPGPFCVFAVVEPAQSKDDQPLKREKFVSTPIFVTFAELEPSEQKSAASVIQGIMDAGQYRQEFEQATKTDPTMRWLRPTSCRYAHPSARCTPIAYSPWADPEPVTFDRRKYYENIYKNSPGHTSRREHHVRRHRSHQ